MNIKNDRIVFAFSSKGFEKFKAAYRYYASELCQIDVNDNLGYQLNNLEKAKLDKVKGYYSDFGTEKEWKAKIHDFAEKLNCNSDFIKSPHGDVLYDTLVNWDNLDPAQKIFIGALNILKNKEFLMIRKTNMKKKKFIIGGNYQSEFNIQLKKIIAPKNKELPTISDQGYYLVLSPAGYEQFNKILDTEYDTGHTPKVPREIIGEVFANTKCFDENYYIFNQGDVNIDNFWKVIDLIKEYKISSLDYLAISLKDNETHFEGIFFENNAGLNYQTIIDYKQNFDEEQSIAPSL